MLIGTYENPLTLNYLLPERSEFKKIVRNGSTFLFKDRPNLGEDVFILNLISNPNLTKSEIVIGSYLHHRIREADDEGMIFWTSETEQPKLKVVDDEGDIWISYDGQPNFIGTPFPNLLSELSAIKVNLSQEVVVTALKTLHKYHYITMTTKHGRVKDSEVLTLKSEFRHIRLYEGMVCKPLYKYWLNPQKTNS